MLDLQALGDEDWAGANPLSPAYRDDPYPFLHRLRERSPVNHTPIGAVRLTRYADIARLLRDGPVRMTLADGSSPNFDPEDRRGSFREFMLNRDGPPHLRLRQLVAKAFTRRAVAQMTAEIQAATDEALAGALARGRLDVIADLARFVPARMICRVMGVPTRTARSSPAGRRRARTRSSRASCRRRSCSTCAPRGRRSRTTSRSSCGGGARSSVTTC
jgi:cytochrome P450